MTPLRLSKRVALPQALQHEWHAALDALDTARVAAWARWRTALESGAFEPCIRDPDKDLILGLNKRGWSGPPGLGQRCSLSDFFALMIQSSPAHWPQSAASCAQCFS